jgi:hypothetical protein
VVAFVIAGLLLPPVTPALANERAIKSPKPELPAVENVKRIRLKPPALDPGALTPDVSKIRDSVIDLIDRLNLPISGNNPPSDDEGEFGMLSGESFFPLEYGRLSHASVPRLGPNENTGSSQYSLPIVAPPGRSGLDPKLELLYYSSFIKNEYLGLGWTTNIPYIERISRIGAENLYTDNYFFSSFGGELRAITCLLTSLSCG